MKRSSLTRRIGLPRKREEPRRDEGRVRHARVKPKPGAPPTAEEKRHMDRLARMDCLVLGRAHVRDLKCKGRVTLHHVSSDGFKRIARSHQRIVPLCEKHHLIQVGPHASVEALGHRVFGKVYGVDLLAEADRLWEESCAD